jgi:hypothetical protein
MFREIAERNFGEAFERSRKKKQTGNPYAQRRSSRRSGESRNPFRFCFVRPEKSKNESPAILIRFGRDEKAKTDPGLRRDDGKTFTRSRPAEG